jgi:glycosyltransferase involved in cell wall biosynthesis
VIFGLAVTGLVLAAIPAILFCINLRIYRPPLLSPLTAGFPHISVLIPARNEEKAIVAAVEAALASRGVEVEVVILNDGSDDATGELVAKIAVHDPRVRLLPGPPLPRGWCGKQHACSVLAAAARYPLFVFVDADVRLAPDGLARLAAFQTKCSADLVSGIPRQETGTWLEHLVIPLIHFILLGFLPMSRMRRSRSLRYAAGCGQLFLTTRAAYEKMGTHEVIRTSLHDGITLPRAYRHAGLMTDLCDATELATCRMYHGARQLWFGLAKNAREGLANPWLIVPATLLLVGGQVMPLALWLAWPWFTPWTTGVNALATLLLFSPRLAGMRRFRQSWLGAVLHPLGVVVLIAIQWYGFFRATVGKPAVWKGRAYR